MNNSKQAELLNAVAEVPPGFGEGGDGTITKAEWDAQRHSDILMLKRPAPKPWRVRLIEFTSSGKRCTFAVPRGMPVPENLHGLYAKNRETYATMLKEAERVGAKIQQFKLVSEDITTVVGSGELHETDGIDEMAWLSCFFFEVARYHMAFVTPDGFEMRNVRNGKTLAVSS